MDTVKDQWLPGDGRRQERIVGKQEDFRAVKFLCDTVINKGYKSFYIYQNP